ncbi:MAG: type VI secretion system tip protein VgrG [Polyangiaceae bacterium]|nr:type VI secretion system tip protein VgrG [Polyangiaceae bacterium]
MSAAGVFELSTDAHAPGELAVVSFRGVEEMSRPFAFDILLRTDHKAQELERDLLGQRVTFTLHGQSARSIFGVASQVEVMGLHAASGERALRLRLVPRLALLRRRRRSRVFEGETAPAIVRRLLTEANVPHVAQLSDSYRPRPLCLQYQETDLAFLTRLLAEEGIYFYFRHDEQARDEVVCLCDEPALLPFVAGEPALKQREHGASQGSEDDVLAFRARARVRPGRVELRDYDFERPQRRDPVVADARHERIAFDERVLSIYEHQGEYEGFEVAEIAARRRIEQLRRRARVAFGESRSRRVLPGHAFELVSETLPELDGPYALLRVAHEGHSPEGERSGTEREVYRNSFEALPAPLPPRPHRRGRRVQQTMETATVVGPAGKDVHTDEHGRIRVRFHWDRGDGVGESSCWIRTMQNWSGAGWGFQFIPRIGMEVVVLFVGGDVDRPLVVGCVPNAGTPVPFPLPGQRTKSGIRSQSSPGGGGYNEISFEDRVGFEQVHVRAEKDFDLLVQHDQLERVGRNATHKVDQNSFLVVGADRLEAVGHDLTRVVSGDERSVVEKDRHDTVKGEERRVVEGSAARLVQRDLSVVVGGTESHATKGDLAFEGGAAVSAVVAGSLLGVVGSAEAPGTIALHVEGGAEYSGTDEVTVRSDTAVNLVCGDSLVRITPSGVQIVAASIVLRADGASQHLGEDKALLLADSLVGLKSDDKVSLFSSGAHVVLASDAKIDGSAVKLKSPASPGDDPTSSSEEPTTIELVDDEGDPVPNARFRIHLASGKELSGVLDAEGKATVRFEGDGEIEFLDLGKVEDA